MRSASTQFNNQWTVEPGRRVSQFLSTNGDGTGTIEMAADHSGAAVEFSIDCPSGKVLTVERITLMAADSVAFTCAGYAGRLALTNGITLEVRNASDESVHDLTATPIKTNVEWSVHSAGEAYWDLGAGNKYCIHHLCGHHLIPQGHKMVMTIHDDLSDLISHKVFIAGYLLDVA